MNAIPVVDEDDGHDYPTVITLDPGGTTGWTVMMVHPDCLTDPDVSILANIMHHEQGQFDGPEVEQAIQIIDLFDAWDTAAIVCEDFQLRTIAAELSPVRIRAMLELHLFREPDEGRSIFLQMPSMATGTMTDARLKDWKLYRPGQEHARDSLRHALMFLRRCTDPNQGARLRKLAWPHIYGG